MFPMRRASAAVSAVAAGGTGDPMDELVNAPVEILPKEVNLSGETDEKLPNTLVITVIQARNLQPAALRTTLSAYVKLSSLGREFKTSVLSKTEEPYWNESFSFRAIDWACSVTLSVRDKINMKMRFLGQVRIACADIANLPGMTTQGWFRLRDKNWERRPGMESELELKVALVYTKRNDLSVVKDLAATAGVDMDDEVVGIIADQDDETEEETLARRKELERLENERKSTLFSNLKQGDYQIQIHVIEARDLKGENLSGTSDPYVLAEVMGMKKKTSTKYETLGCVFDEILFFHFKNIGRNELKNAAIKLSVYDKENVMKDNLIGTYQLDCLSVYFRPHHELYRQWIAIHDHLNDKDRGIQGFVLVSINVIGPGDAFLVHDREAEIAQELQLASATAAAAGTDSGGGQATPGSLALESPQLVLLPPTIDLKLHFLVIRVFKAEDLPAMDQGGMIVASGIDAYVQVGFGPNTMCKTSVVTVKGNAHLAPEFLEELWIPVLAPTLSRHIAISVWDRDLGRSDDLVGIATHDYQQVANSTAQGGLFARPEAGRSTEEMRRELELMDTEGAEGSSPRDVERVDLRWYNIYGPPLKRINKKRAGWIAQNPEFGSTYRGRVLLSMERVETPLPEESEKFHVKRMKESLSQVEPRFPRTVKYVLRCALFCGTDLPLCQSLTSSTTRHRVTISIGAYEIAFDAQQVTREGTANWEECKERWPVLLPADLTQLPDVIVTLSRQLDKDTFVSVSFARLSAADMFAQSFTTKPQWVQLREEVARRQTKYAIDKSQAPGSLLMRIGFGREEVAVRNPWGDDTSQFTPFRHNRVHREIRVHIFQFRRLVVPEGKTRLPNPFVSVRCCGQVQKTECKYKTLDPLFYESIVFAVHVPQDVQFSPDLVFNVHDGNISTSTSTMIPGAILGELRIPMNKATKAVANANPSRPSWFKLLARPVASSGSGAPLNASLFIEEARGDALISIQYVDHQGPLHHFYPPERGALVPEYEEAQLDIVAIGVRKLKALGILGVRNPFVEFELTGGHFSDGTQVRKTKPATSTGANGKNANFLEHLKILAKLPIDTLFAPQLCIRVCEASIGGLRKTTVASCTVDLSSKLPWSSEYVAPQNQNFENPRSGATVATSPDRDSSRRKSRFELLERIGRSKRRKSQAMEQLQESPDPGALSGHEEILSDEELLSDEDGRESPKRAEVAPTDDGLGVGGFTLQPMSLSASLRRKSQGPTVNVAPDPAVQQQLEMEERRRYIAGHADLMRGGTTGLYRPTKPPVSSGDASHETDLSDLDSGSHVAPFMAGRDWWINQGGEELEKFLRAKALETYPLYRSVLTRPSLLKRKRVRVQLRAGVFKGLITVTERRRVQSEAMGGKNKAMIDIEKLKEPQTIVVRVYVLRGSNLQAKDVNGFSDPYLRLKLGKDVISDRTNYRKKTLNPEFFRSFTFNTTLPGPSQLEIAVWDHDLIKKDDFIGSTTIDLEDRWFHKDWQQIGQGHPKLQETGGCLKPIEYRHLYTTKRTTSQGFLQLWVDILTSQQAALIPPINIEPPAPKKFEVRVVIWRAEGVTDKEHSEVNDYFVKAWMEGGKAESTDVHWRCANGKPCWNWRFKFPVEYPLRTAEFGRLHIQLWDKDVLKWNDILGEAQLDLYKWLRRAYETNRAVTPFLELKALAKAGVDGTGLNTTAASSIEDDDKGSTRESDEEDGLEEDDEDDEDDNDGMDDSEDVLQTATESHSLLRNQGKKKQRLPKTMGLKAPVKMKKPKYFDKSAQATAKEARRRAKEENNARSALNGLLDFIGLGNLPDDAEWITIFYTDRESAVSMEMGRIGLSISIVPEKEAQMNPVGKGQEAPNINPYLPPPVGRMRLTANPVMMLKELVGPKMCMRIACVCCCVGCMMFIGVFGATIMSTMTFFEEMSRNNGPQFIGQPVDLPNWPYATGNSSLRNASVSDHQ